MTITHDFVLVDSMEDTSRWTPVGDGALSLNTTNYIEGSGAINIYKPNTTTTLYGAQLTLQNPIDVANKLLVFYLYVDYSLRNVIKYFNVRVYDVNGNYKGFRRDNAIAWNKWIPVIINCNTSLTGIDWHNINRIEIRVTTWSSSQTTTEGSLVVDRLIAGSGFYVLYVTDINPHTLRDIAQLDAKNNFMLVEQITQYTFVVRGKIHVGNGTDVGALKIYRNVISLDATQMDQWNDGNIIVYKNSYLIIQDSIVNHVTRDYYTYGSAGIRLLSGSVFRVKNSAYISSSPFFYGGAFRHDFGISEFTAEDFMTNIMLWMFAPTVRNLNWSGIIALLPKASFIFDDYAVNGLDIYSTMYVFKDAEIVPRQSKNLRFYSTVFAGGRFRTDSSIGILYNPVNIIRDNLYAGGRSSIIKVYYDIDIYLIDRYGNPISNADVKIFDKNYNAVGEDTTDNSGKVHFTILVLHKETDSSGTLIIDEDYNPFTVEAYVSGGLIARNKIEVYERKTFYITPDNVYSIYTYPEKPSILLNEPIKIYTVIKQVDGTPISGLTVKADIEKPDHTTNTIDLVEDTNNPGTYIGEYMDTDRVGTYNYRVYTWLGQVYIETYNKFFVGVLENKIDNVYDLLKKHDSKMTAFKFI